VAVETIRVFLKNPTYVLIQILQNWQFFNKIRQFFGQFYAYFLAKKYV
jgi:hypothetical protein